MRNGKRLDDEERLESILVHFEELILGYGLVV